MRKVSTGWLFKSAAMVLFSLAGLQACSSPCLQIQEVLCKCQGQTQSEQNTCVDNASQQEKLQPPTDATLTTCEQLLPECEKIINDGKGCATLQTDEGRKACGLSPK